MSLDPTNEMLRLLSGYWMSQALYVFAELGIPDLLEEGPRTADELADATATDSDALYRLLRGLASGGVLDEIESRRFTLTPLAETLCSNRAYSLRPVARLGGHPLHWQAWGELLHSVRTGENAFQAAHGRGFFEALEEDPELATTFQQVLSRLEGIDRAVLDALDLSDCGLVVDVGGGGGAFARQLADAFPDASIVLFDRPSVVATAEHGDRVRPVGGSFFDRVPARGDAYVLKFVLHDWDDEHALQILRRCREAMRSGGRLFVVEVIVPDGIEPSYGKTHDLNMLVLTGGRERTAAQLEQLLTAAGLVLEERRAVGHEVFVLVASVGIRAEVG